MSTKLELASQRVQLIERLVTTKEPAAIAQVQAELTDVNRQIKALNVAEAQLLQKRAVARTVRGQVENDENLSRAERKNGQVSRGQGSRSPDGKSSLGEMIIVRAKQLAQLIGRVPAASSLPHTDIFAPQLDAFILQQKQHLKNVSSTTSSETDWHGTWEATPEET